MVDFNNEATITTPSIDIVKVLILQARANVLEALEHYNKNVSKGIDIEQSVLRARIGVWFLEHQAYLKRTKKPEEYDTLYNKMLNKIFFTETNLTNEEILELISELNTIIDKLGITKLDFRKVYDRTKIELDNENNELG
jgi:hypothetical protein